MIGFIFRGIHSSEFNIGFRSLNRTVIPERRKKEFEILGKSGTLELESQEYEKRTITGVIGVLEIDNWESLRHKMRDIAGWLSGNGLLIFDDEPNKAYEAGIYAATGIEQLELQPRGLVNIEFECQPFAVSKDLNHDSQIGESQIIYEIENKGNIKTCGDISIKNIGDQVINTIRVTRKAVKE